MFKIRKSNGQNEKSNKNIQFWSKGSPVRNIFALFQAKFSYKKIFDSIQLQKLFSFDSIGFFGCFGEIFVDWGMENIQVNYSAVQFSLDSNEPRRALEWLIKSFPLMVTHIEHIPLICHSDCIGAFQLDFLAHLLLMTI